MDARAGSPVVSLTLAFLLATPLASALSQPSLSMGRTAKNLGANMFSRRQENKTVIPAAVEIAPSQYWDGIDGPWSSFALQLGAQFHQQTIRIMPGTAAATTLAVGADGCPDIYGSLQDCIMSRGSLYLSNESLTWVPNSGYNLGIEVNLGLDTTADSGYETVTLGYNGAGGPTVDHSVVQVYNVANYWLGIFGLRPDPTNFTNMDSPQPSFMTELVDHNGIPSLTYGYTAGAQYRLSGVYGSLVLGGYDQNRFDSAQNISLGMYTDINRDLLIYLQGITTDSGSPSNLLPDGAINIFVDSTVGQLWLPESACSAFEQAFGLEYDDDFGYYTVNNSLHDALVERNANVTFTIGSQGSGGPTVDIVLPYGAFDLNLSFPYVIDPNNTYYFPLKRAANETQYTLGRAFLQESYLIADYDNRNFTIAPCVWDQDKVSQSSLISILRANETQAANGNGSGSGTNVGAIAGGVVGGIVGLAIIAALVIYFLRRRKQVKRKRIAELDAKNTSVGNGDGNQSADSGKPFISAPIGGELGGEGEIHEMNAPFKQNAQEMESPYKGNPGQLGYSEMQGGSGYFAPGKDDRVAEVHGSTPIYEMPGSDVNELGDTERIAAAKPK